MFGLNKMYISGKVTNIKFKQNKNDYIDINLNTPIGDLIILRKKDADKYLTNSLIKEELEPKDINKLFKKATNPELIFNDLDILNKRIVKYADEFGIDITSSGSPSINGRLAIKSNNYSSFDEIYKVISGCDINSTENTDIFFKKNFKPLSIVISSYNSEETILEVLNSIESQNLSFKQKKLLDVIVIDDGSDKLLSEAINQKFTFNLNLLRLETNRGLSYARNLGSSLSIHDKILFMDSDILLAKNYLLRHSIALQLFPDSLFVSLKNNIDSDSNLRNLENIKKGVDVPSTFNDKRIIRVFKKNESWTNKVKIDGIHETISETDCFKLFGHKKLMGGYDLASMVVGHNMSLSKSLLQKTGGFSSHFVGWGLEDTYFGAKIIASGGFVVPLLGTGVLHINHALRSGSLEKQQEEYKKNLEIYNSLIEKEI